MEAPVQRSNRLINEMSPNLTQKILAAIQEIRFGSVEITIHDSKVVQIERKEKIRIETDSSRTS